MMNKNQFNRIVLSLVMLTVLLVPSIVHPAPARAAWLTGWVNKVPITITNTGAALTDYQVQINLDTNNFTFSEAKSDGSDVRFTAADGISLLPYWMESWQYDSTATFWVKVSSLPAGGAVTIYMYYNNPSPTTSISNGYDTFAFFDDFEGSFSWTLNRGTGTFAQSTNYAKRGTRSGIFNEPTGASGSTIWLKSQPLANDFIQEWDMYDDLTTTAFKMVRVTPSGISGVQFGVGVWTGSSVTNYAYHHNGYNYVATSAARTLGWHKFGIQMTGSTTSTFFVDNNQVGQQSGSSFSAAYVSVEGIAEAPNTYYVDDFRVRKYAAPAPTVAIGTGGQAAVDMAIALTDTPDPVRVNQMLTYQITVNNYGDLDATNVTVNDTLPANVTFVSASAGCSQSNPVTCNLGSIASGGSATITIVVTTTQEGQLSNTATVSCFETDPNPANNTSTATTAVGNPVVYVVNAVDTEAFNNHPTTPQHVPFDLRNFIKTSTVYIGPIMASTFRNNHLDSYGNPFKMTWYVEMDNFINNGVYADGSPMTYLTLYNTFVRNYGSELQTYGDELAYHHHFTIWNGSSWIQSGHEHANDGQYDEHNNALDRMVLDANFFPTDFRSGWLNESNQLQAWVEKWMLADFSSSWSSSWIPYHPSTTDYTQAGSMNHWIASCPGSPSQASVTAAFNEAATKGKPVIYCWYGHDREDMSSYLTSLQGYLDTASTATGVTFRYATSKEAMQAVIETTDTTPPVLNIAQGSGDIFHITSNEAVWNNAPYVTARYLAPSGLRYIHTTAAPSGTNAWTATIPDQQTWTTTTPGEKYTLVGVTASSEKPGNPATYAIDGNETTFWDSYDLPQWIRVDLGSSQLVPLLTIHFYDGDSRTYTYSVDASTDGTTWTEIVSSRSVHGTATHAFDPAVNMRYARVNVTAQSINNFAHIYEITLYETPPSTTSETGYLQQVGAGAGDLSGNTSVANLIMRPMADLSITKTSTPQSGRLGSDLTYNLTVTNHGPTGATGIQVTDNLPAGLTFVSASASQGTGCNQSNPVSCSLGELASGASATVSIVVTPSAEATYVNTASVSTTSTDPVQTNNTATLSTVVGNPIVYVVNAVDTEAFNNHPTTPQHVTFDVHNFIKGQSTYIEPLMAADFRNANRDSFNTPFKMTWYVEMDNFINNGVYANGQPMDYLTLYNTFVSNFNPELTTWGDELAYHHHFSIWNGTSWIQSGHEHATDGQYDEHNSALDRMVIDANFFPTDFRSGWLNESNQLQAWVEKWMLADDSGSGWATGWIPYHPSATDYTQVGNMNHWMVNCPGGSINAAFAQAQLTGKPVIYCWYGHDRDNLSSYISGIQASATSASTSYDVPFKYATAKEAMQAVMGTTDTTPPVLTIAHGSGDTFHIASNEAVWNNAPYVAVRYLAPSGLKYTHTTATPTGATAWTATIPDQQTFTTVIPPEKYIPVGVTASSQWLPDMGADKAIDGNDSTYWDSTPMSNPNWIRVDLGQVKSVKVLTIHFYDNDGRNYSYYVEASQDGTNWTSLVSSNNVVGLATHTFDTPVDLRYARVTVTLNSAGSYAHIYEISLYDSDTSTTVEETGNLQQVGLGAGDLSGNTSVASLIIRPTAVTVSSFTGSSHLSTAHLDWETANEMELVGFNLYRAETLDGARHKLNANMISAEHSGQIFGASYQFIDAVEQGKRFYYWLELVTSHGTELLEPVVVNTDYLIRLPLMIR